MDPKEVKGPTRFDTEEQERTRGFHSAEESEEKALMSHDDDLSTLQQNFRGANVDDRGVERSQNAHI